MASTIYVDKVDPASGTALEIGTSGDTITIPSGVTLTNNGTASGFGKINQVVSETLSSAETFTSGTLTASGLTASITPSATSSKVYFHYVCPALMSSAANSYAELRIYRAGSELAIYSDMLVYNALSQTATQSMVFSYLDSPSSTSSLTYSVKYAEHGSATLNLMNSSGSGGTGTSTMTLMEVLA